MSGSDKILIVDDDPINRDFFKLMLSKLGFMVDEADDGTVALEVMEKFHPHLILLDNIMPGMSGFELTKILKEHPKFRYIPIIMFSALDDDQDRLAGFELGIDDYVTKPFNFTEVVERIKGALRKRELLTQLVVRESRLYLAEDLIRDMKQQLADLGKNIDTLDSGDIREKIRELDARIDKTILEWETLKKEEIEISVLETRMRKSSQQD